VLSSKCFCTTASVTVATADLPPRVRAAEPKRPISTCLVLVGALPRRLPSPVPLALASRLWGTSGGVP
jgi:hypothetical protein